MKIIDAHNHPDWHGHDLNKFLANMDRYGIEKTWLLNWECPEHEYNVSYKHVVPAPLLGSAAGPIPYSRCVSYKERAPERFVLGYCPDPRLPDACARLKAAHEIYGAKVCGELKCRFPALSVHHDSAANLPRILDRHGRQSAEVIVSGLPWAIFPDELQQEILESVIASLAPGGCFTTFAYLQGLLLPAGRRFRKRLHELFDTVETSQVVWCNLPPAFVYRCRSRGTK